MNKSRTKPLIPLSAGRSQGGAELRGFIGGFERSDRGPIEYDIYA
jgi:hypothetical protein